MNRLNSGFKSEFCLLLNELFYVYVYYHAFLNVYA